MLTQLTRNWWALALRGLFAILFGIGAFAWPGITLFVLVALFGAYALVDGVFAIISSISHRKENRHWWAVLIEGVISVVAAFVAWSWPGITAFAMIFVIGGWAIATGIFEIISAVRLRKEITNEWMLGLSGVLSIVFGLLLFAKPGAGALSVIWLIGAYAIMFGAMLIALGFWLRGIKSQLPPAPTEREIPASGLPAT